MHKVQLYAAAAVAALIASPLAGVVTAHAANVATNCAGLDAALAAAANGDVITLHDTALCTGAHTLLTGIQITLQGQAATDGFDGGGTNRILVGSGNGATVIRNLLFQHGMTAGSGGAILLSGTVNPTITQDSFFDNHAAGSGGAVSIDASTTTGPMTITHDVFGASARGNSSTGSAGGALAVVQGGDKTVTDNVFDSNSGTFAGGGALILNFSENVATIDFERNLVTGNALAGGDGGGVELLDNGSITVAANVFKGNTIATATQSFNTNHGGGLSVSTFGTGQNISQSHNLFSSNSVATANDNNSDVSKTFDFGGGGEFALAPLVTSLDDTFQNNTVGDAGARTTPVGGGFGLQGTNGRKTTLTATNLVATNNTVGRDGEGGGIYAGFSAGCNAPPCTAEVDLFDSTVDGNGIGPAGTGPGLGGDQTDTANLVNSIVFGNSGNAQQVDGFGTIAVNHSDSCLAAGSAYAGTGNTCVDPKLASVAGNDVHETAASPTIDAGDTAQVPAGVTSDYEADARVQGARVDIGADEFTPAPVVPTLPKAGAGPQSGPGFATWALLAALLGGLLVWRDVRRGIRPA